MASSRITLRHIEPTERLIGEAGLEAVIYDGVFGRTGNAIA